MTGLNRPQYAVLIPARNSLLPVGTRGDAKCADIGRTDNVSILRWVVAAFFSVFFFLISFFLPHVPATLRHVSRIHFVNRDAGICSQDCGDRIARMLIR